MISSSQLNLSQKLEDCLSSVWLLGKSKISQVFNGFTQSETSSRTQTPENNSDTESSLDESSISKFCSRSDLDPTLKRIGDALQHSIFYSSEFLTLPSKYQALCTQIQKQVDSLDLITQHSSVFLKKNQSQLTLMMIDLLNLVCEMVDDLYWNAKSLDMKVKAPFYGLKFFRHDFDLLDELSYADYLAYQSDSAGNTSYSIRMLGNVDVSSTQLSLLRSAADASSIMAHQSLRAIFAINAEGPHHVRIVCYHAAGAICTEKINLQTSMYRFIEAMVCVLIKDPEQAGIDSKMNREGVVTPFGCYRVVKDFVNSPAYLGKSLRVCLLESQSESSRSPSTADSISGISLQSQSTKPYQHRISIILLNLPLCIMLDQSVIQQPMQISSNSHLSEISELFIKTQCTAFLHDLDLAYSHQNQKVIYQKEVKGTRGFLSIRLLKEKVKNSKKFFLQNSIDDLESFLWLLIKVIYQIQKPKKSFTKTDLKMMKKLNHDCSDQLMLNNKLDLINYFLNEKSEDEDKLSSISPIKPLLKNLFQFMSIQKCKLDKLSKSKNCFNQLDVLVIETYKTFFKELISVIPNLPNTWEI
ncbi:uncharacterized protein MELLADRAFT_105992 [Melampsora larici-populina 98AG31]|uniref:Fungal-type protein kinase domain-containing protein n=1 Tax=Melampsora larici-populina (strain 98AG31 / pathotype 3-4-7) TaxID=747676 RepID=F4RK04_MELLP|nr:uncharacterized protein MELLADRAFT_105992 [Melampsora larici-populina 98AG31]EGG07407.1 hypothetical protein MELLADRAFT_105992 [Melampsora larici-populina 98AG31]